MVNGAYFLKRDHWLAAGKKLVHDRAGRGDQKATDELLNAVRREGWMDRGVSTPIRLRTPMK
jgi:hypothetical protein